MNKDEEKISKLLTRGVDEVIELGHLKERLTRGDKLRVKLGIDPTAKDLHLGHTVVLRKLKHFQVAGHQAVLIIGDFTALVGDPSGRSELRPQLTPEQIQDNLKNYLEEAGKIIDIKKTEVCHNSDWFKDKGVSFFMELASKFTVARSLERDDFQKRLKENRDISILEIIYPLLQGYDSLEVRADVELGGTDQKFNLLMGRKVQRRYGQPEQDIITVPLVEGLDGIRKMSKSLGNYISISDSPIDMFGKIMSIPDDLMVKYFELLTEIPTEEIEQLKKDRIQPALASLPPKEWKEKLAHELVLMYHSTKEADQVKAEWNRVFSKKELPSKIEEFEVKNGLMPLGIFIAGWLKISNSEAKRLIGEQDAVRVNDNLIIDWNYEVKKGDTVQVGPRKFVRIVK